MARSSVAGYPATPSPAHPLRTSLSLLVLASVLCAGTAHGGTPDPWYELRTPNFIVSGDASPENLRVEIEELEVFRNALATLYPSLRTEAGTPTRVIVFKDTRRFHRFLPRDPSGRSVRNVDAFYLASPDADFIVLGASGKPSDRRAVLHEYVHHALRRSVSALPLWLNEGLAEFYSTFDHTSTFAPTILGRPPADVLSVLRTSEFVPLYRIVDEKGSSGLLSDTDRARVFYAESWALVHYLLIGRPGASNEQMAALIDALMRDVPPEAAFVSVYGMSLGQLEDEVRVYVRQQVFRGMQVNPGDHPVVAASASPLSQGAIKELYGELLLRVGTLDEAERELTAALALEPANLDARLALARLMLATGRLAQGRAALQSVAAAAPKNFAAQYYLGGSLAVQRRYDDAFACFDAAVRLRPNSVSALYAFSSVALALGLDDAAEAAIQESMRLEFNPEAYRARAYAALGLGRNSAAARDALRYIDTVGWNDPVAPSTAFVAAVAYWRTQRPEDAAAILDRVRSVVPSSSWAGAVAEFLQGSLPAERLLARAKDVEQRTAAHTYIGLKDVLAGRREEALAHFRWVKDEGTRHDFDYGVAIEELVRIETSERK